MKRTGLLALVLCAGTALAQSAPCPDAGEVGQADLLGAWQAEIAGVGPFGTLVLARHAEYAESFSGILERDGQRRQLAGDVDDGAVTLEESADGVHIAAAWVGEVVPGSCAREIRGVWTPDGQETGRPFVLRRQ